MLFPLRSVVGLLNLLILLFDCFGDVRKSRQMAAEALMDGRKNEPRAGWRMKTWLLITLVLFPMVLASALRPVWRA
jgi:hypothetical protein